MAINKTQKKVVAIAIPVIVVLVGFGIIGSRFSTSTPFGESGIAFNLVSYLANNGVGWSFVVLLIGAFEFFWWKDRDKKSE